MKHRTRIALVTFVFASLWCFAAIALFGFTVAFAQAAPMQPVEATPTPRPLRTLHTLDIPIKTQLPMQMSLNGRAPFLNIEQVALPDDLLQAILKTLSSELDAKTAKADEAIHGTQFALTSARVEEGWALISLGSVDGAASVPGYVGNGEAGALILAHFENGNWLLAIEGTPAFAELLADVPDAFINQQAKSLLLQTPNSNAPQAITPTVTYKWPWPAGSKFYWWQGWHSRSALDMGTLRTDRRVLASASGVVRFICKGKLGAAIKIKDADGVTLEYWHIDSKLLDPDVKEGALLGQGQILGSLRPGTWVDPTCGNQFTQQSATNSHLHWELPKDRPITIDGWTITQTQSVFTNGAQKRVCVGACFSSFVSFDSSNIAFSGLPQIRLSPDMGLASRGEVITLAVSISNARNLSALQFVLNYSPAQFTVQSMAPGDWAGRMSISAGPNTLTPTVGTATFSATGSLANNTGAGTLAYIGMRAHSVGTASLQISSTLASHNAVLTVVESGCPGDYDRDSDIDVLDIQRVAYRWDSQKGDVPYDAGVDTDGDGHIDQADLQRVANRLGTRCNTLKPRANAAENAVPMAGAQLVVVSNTVLAGDVFTVGVAISDVNALGAFDLSLGYTPIQFEVLSVALADFPGRTARSFTQLDWVTRTVSPSDAEHSSDVQHSILQFSAYSLGTWPAGPSGAGQLAEVTLRALSAGDSELRIEAMQLSDVAGKPQEVALPALSIQVMNEEAEASLVPRIYLPVLMSDALWVEPELTPTPSPTPEPTATDSPVRAADFLTIAVGF